jgi:hypothetical protein
VTPPPDITERAEEYRKLPRLRDLHMLTATEEARFHELRTLLLQHFLIEDERPTRPSLVPPKKE